MDPGNARNTMLSLLVNVPACLTNGLFCLLFITLVIHSSLDRLYVESITSGVTGGSQKSYPTYSEALSVYSQLKSRGLLQVIRDPGDEWLFGPLDDAIQ